jgi:hypothetical protein
MTVYPPVSVFLGDCDECQLELDGGELAEGSLASRAVAGVLDPHEDRVGRKAAVSAGSVALLGFGPDSGVEALASIIRHLAVHRIPA